MAKTYTKKELIDFIRRADTPERCKIARYYLAKMKMSDNDREYLEAELGSQERWVNDEWGADEWEDDDRDWSPSAPWNAPGMRVSDFITGVRCW